MSRNADKPVEGNGLRLNRVLLLHLKRTSSAGLRARLRNAYWRGGSNALASAARTAGMDRHNIEAILADVAHVEALTRRDGGRPKRARKSIRNSGVSSPTLGTVASTLRRSPSRTIGKHGLRVLDPRTRGVVWSDTVNLGSESYARRVPLPVARLAARGGIVEVATSRGWSRRRVVKGRDGAHYLRTV